MSLSSQLPTLTLTRQVVLFDLDGTLSESEPGITGSIAHAFSVAGLPVPSQDRLRLAIGPDLVDIFPVLGVPVELVDVVIGHYRERYEHTGLYETRLYDGIADVLTALRQAGCELAVASAKPERSTVRVVEHLGIAEHFATVAGSDRPNGVVTKADVIAVALQRLGRDAPGSARDDIVMIGDRHHDIDGARHHGIDTIAVGWGYGDAVEHADAGALATANSPADILALLAGGT